MNRVFATFTDFLKYFGLGLLIAVGIALLMGTMLSIVFLPFILFPASIVIESPWGIAAFTYAVGALIGLFLFFGKTAERYGKRRKQT